MSGARASCPRWRRLESLGHGEKETSQGSLVVDIPSAPGLTSLNIEYDAASRLARETLFGSWDVRYQYDQGENRTLLDVNGDITTFAHGAGNRETGAFPTALLQYDFKGNVTVRPPLDGSDAFSYQ